MLIIAQCVPGCEQERDPLWEPDMVTGVENQYWAGISLSRHTSPRRIGRREKLFLTLNFYLCMDPAFFYLPSCLLLLSILLWHLINFEMKCKFCAKASFSQPLILLAPALHPCSGMNESCDHFNISRRGYSTLVTWTILIHWHQDTQHSGMRWPGQHG